MKGDAEIALLKEIESLNLLDNLIQQIQKDADLSGAIFDCDKDVTAKEFILKIYDFLLELMTTDFGTYLNFLYRVDLSETTLQSITDTEPNLIAKQVTYMVLKREWKKVWFKSKTQ